MGINYNALNTKANLCFAYSGGEAKKQKVSIGVVKIHANIQKHRRGTPRKTEFSSGRPNIAYWTPRRDWYNINDILCKFWQKRRQNWGTNWLFPNDKKSFWTTHLYGRVINVIVTLHGKFQGHLKHNFQEKTISVHFGQKIAISAGAPKNILHTLKKI